ncbi:MAG: hypothetical protein QW618_04825, partial [Nitrososphaerales archaeon]
RLSNNQIDQIFKILSPSLINEICEKCDFDYHSSILIQALSVKEIVKILGVITIEEFKNLASLLGIYKAENN